MLLSLTPKHYVTVISMLVVLLIGSTIFSTIDIETLKPSESFPDIIKNISTITNFPIKIGLMHLVLYTFEYFYFPELVSTHIGQRLSTLWLQYFENPRWGQHFHMQMETALQICDIITRADKVNGNRFKNKKKLFWMIGLVFCRLVLVAMLLTNFITSSAYHTFKEQCLGAVVALAKIVFDYHSYGQKNNQFIGESLTTIPEITIAIGVLFLCLGYIVLHLVGLDADSIIAHPTVVATSFFMGGLTTPIFTRPSLPLS